MKKIISWVVYSSSNANQISLTIKGVLMTVAVLATQLLPIENLPELVESIAVFVQQALTLAGTLVVIGGGIRKIVTTIKGSNDVLNTVE